MTDLPSYLEHTIQEFYKDKLVAAYFEGSYGSGDEIPGYSDVDILVIVSEPDLDFPLVEYDNLDIQMRDKVFNQQDNIKLTEWLTQQFSPISLIKLKYKTKLITGQDVRSEIGDLTALLQANFQEELEKEYLHAITPTSPGYIFRREPRKWINYIINMADLLLLVKGKIVKKEEIPAQLELLYPDFPALETIWLALELRGKRFVHTEDAELVSQIRKALESFLEAFASTALSL